MTSDFDDDEKDWEADCPYPGVACFTTDFKKMKTKDASDVCANSVRGITYLEFDLIDIAYSYTCGNRQMAHEIGQASYEWLKKRLPEIDELYEKLV